MRCAFAVLFLVPLLCSACSEKQEPEVTAPPAGIARLTPATDAEAVASLVPEDAAYLLRISSVAELQAIVERLRTVWPPPLPPDVLPLMTAAVRLDPGAVERDRPLFVCANLAERDQLARLTLIAPVKDPEALAQAHRMGGSGVAGGYVALSQLEKGYAAGGSPLVTGIQGGDISSRVDLTRVISKYRADIDEGLHTLEEGFAMGARRSLPAFDPSDMSARMVEWVRRLVDSAETLDAVVNHDDGRFDIQVALTARKGSPLAKSASGAKSGLVQLGRYLPPDMAVTMLLRLDVAGMSDLFLPMLVALMEKRPAEERRAMEGHVARMNEAAALLTDDWAMALDFGEGGMRIAMVGGARDAAAYLAAYRELLQTPVLGQMGMAFTSAGRRDVAGTTVERMRMTFDVAKYMAFLGLDEFDAEAVGGINAAMALMFGEDGLVFELAAQEGRLFVASGGEKLMDGMLRAERAPAWLEGTAGAIGGQLGFLCRVEVRRCARGFGEMMTKLMPGTPIPAYPDGEELPVVLYGSRDGRVYRGGLTFELDKLAAFFRGGRAPPK